MSDERKPSDPGHTSIPPELVPYMGRHQIREAEVRDTDPRIAAAFDVLHQSLLRDPPPQEIDPSRGVGNVSEYVASIEIRGGARAAEPPAPETAKVALAMTDEEARTTTDMLLRLPAGNPTSQTVETRVENLRPRMAGDDASEDDVTRDDVTVTTPESRSRWVEVTARVGVGIDARELPSSHAPASGRGPEAAQKVAESERAPARGPTRTPAWIAAMALAGVAAVLGVRRMTSSPPVPVVVATSAQSAVVVAVPVNTALPRAVPTQEPRASAPSASVAPAAITTASVAPAVRDPKKGSREQAVADDPYDAASPAPTATAVTSAAPTAIKSAPPPYVEERPEF